MKLRSLPLWPPDSVPVEIHASGAWLVACERGVRGVDLAAELGLGDAEVFDVSALEWIDEATALRDLTRAVGGPNVHAQNWNALHDGLHDLPEPALVIVRDIDPRHERWLGTFVAIFDPTVGPRSPRRVLALEDWRHGNVEEITPTAWKADVYEVTPTSAWSTNAVVGSSRDKLLSSQAPKDEP